ncbi:MAG: nitroreductase family deazaflavin-dependent oxidoreductase [Anaerolineales bacterium]|nr:nitroreductase family deazaflavin-dependent oxidoreductase [Anaerolineales bacterium]
MTDTNTQLKSPPKGFARLLWRAPIWFYKVGLGWMLGKRFLLLNHIGRKSGKPRQAVLEVVRFDKDTHTYYVASGFGEKSDWFQNVMQHPDVTIQVGGKHYETSGVRLSQEAAEDELLTYNRHHPAALKNLASLMNYPYDGTEDSIRKLAALLPIISFKLD